MRSFLTCLILPRRPGSSGFSRLLRRTRASQAASLQRAQRNADGRTNFPTRLVRFPLRLLRFSSSGIPPSPARRPQVSADLRYTPPRAPPRPCPLVAPPLPCTRGFPPLGTPSGRERRADLGTRGGRTLAVAPTTSRD